MFHMLTIWTEKVNLVLTVENYLSWGIVTRWLATEFGFCFKVLSTNDGVWCHPMKDFMGKWISFSYECNSYVQYFNTLNCRLWATESTNVIHKISFHSPKIIACRDFTPSFIIAPYFFKDLLTVPVMCSIIA